MKGAGTPSLRQRTSPAALGGACGAAGRRGTTRAPLLLIVLLALLAGCDDSFANRLGMRTPAKTFEIGKAEKYRRPGVYQDFRRSQGVWVVSFQGMVVALSTACPRDGEETYFDDMPQQFKCPRCAARYDSNGLPRAPQDAEAALVRFRIEPTDKSARGEDVVLKVTPRIQFRQEENEWSNRFSFYELDPE